MEKETEIHINKPLSSGWDMTNMFYGIAVAQVKQQIEQTHQ